MPAGQAVLIGFLKNIISSGPQTLRETLQDFSKINTDKRLVLNLVQADRPAGYDYDAIVEWWFDDTDQLLERLGPVEIQIQLQAAFDSICDLKSSVFMATQVTHRRP